MFKVRKNQPPPRMVFLFGWVGGGGYYRLQGGHCPVIKNKKNTGKTSSEIQITKIEVLVQDSFALHQNIWHTFSLKISENLCKEEIFAKSLPSKKKESFFKKIFALAITLQKKKKKIFWPQLRASKCIQTKFFFFFVTLIIEYFSDRKFRA